MTLAYRGTHYHGWQWQYANELYKGPPPPPGHGIPTVQEKLIRAFTYVLGHPVQVVGSSRTDAGVHAKGQVAHFDTFREHIPPEGIRRSVNHQLPDDILIRAIEPAADDFDAILHTRSKRYQYAIWNAEDRPLFNADLYWHRWQTLDIAAMRQAAALLVGTHDFTSFAKAGHGRQSPVRNIHSLDICQRGPKIVIGVEGNGFLWRMIRIIVGTLVEVGLGRYGPDRVQQMLKATHRPDAGPTAPPQGLYLQWINY